MLQDDGVVDIWKALGEEPKGMAGVVALWGLDLDHVGAQVAEHQRAVGPGQSVRQIQDPDPVQR